MKINGNIYAAVISYFCIVHVSKDAVDLIL